MPASRFSRLFALAAFAFAACAHAQLAPPEADGVQRFDGVVKVYLLNEFGDVEGVIANDGTQVRFPPHMGPDLVAALKPGDAFTAQGGGVRGRSFRAYALGKTGSAQLTEGRPSAGRVPQPRDARIAALRRLDADSVVVVLLRSPRDEIDGALLADGTIVRLPPRSEAVGAATLRPGVRMQASGYGTQNAYGRCLRAEMLGLDGKTMTALQPRGPELPPRPPATPDRPAPPAR